MIVFSSMWCHPWILSFTIEANRLLRQIKPFPRLTCRWRLCVPTSTCVTSPSLEPVLPGRRSPGSSPISKSRIRQGICRIIRPVPPKLCDRCTAHDFPAWLSDLCAPLLRICAVYRDTGQLWGTCHMKSCVTISWRFPVYTSGREKK
jgi:hypothetical protein